MCHTPVQLNFHPSVTLFVLKDDRCQKCMWNTFLIKHLCFLVLMCSFTWVESVGPEYDSSSVLTKYSSLICDTILKCKEQIFKSVLTLSSCFVLWVFCFVFFWYVLNHFRPQLSYFSILLNDISLSCHSLVPDVSPVGNEFNKEVVYKVSASLSLIVSASFVVTSQIPLILLSINTGGFSSRCPALCPYYIYIESNNSNHWNIRTGIMAYWGNSFLLWCCRLNQRRLEKPTVDLPLHLENP